MLFAFSSAPAWEPAPIAKRGVVNNDEVSDHESDYDVIDEKMDELINSETQGNNNNNNNMNQNWMTIFLVKDLLLRIFVLSDPRDIIRNKRDPSA